MRRMILEMMEEDLAEAFEEAEKMAKIAAKPKKAAEAPAAAVQPKEPRVLRQRLPAKTDEGKKLEEAQAKSMRDRRGSSKKAATNKELLVKSKQILKELPKITPQKATTKAKTPQKTAAKPKKTVRKAKTEKAEESSEDEEMSKTDVGNRSTSQEKTRPNADINRLLAEITALDAEQRKVYRQYRDGEERLSGLWK